MQAELRKQPGDVQIESELRKQPGVVWPEVNHRESCAAPLALPACLSQRPDRMEISCLSQTNRVRLPLQFSSLMRYYVRRAKASALCLSVHDFDALFPMNFCDGWRLRGDDSWTSTTLAQQALYLHLADLYFLCGRV